MALTNIAAADAVMSHRREGEQRVDARVFVHNVSLLAPHWRRPAPITSVSGTKQALEGFFIM